MAKGVPLDVVVAFLTASQSAGLDSAAITWGLLGRDAALCRLVGAVILATAAGLAVSSVSSRRTVTLTLTLTLTKALNLALTLTLTLTLGLGLGFGFGFGFA